MAQVATRVAMVYTLGQALRKQRGPFLCRSVNQFDFEELAQVATRIAMLYILGQALRPCASNMGTRNEG